jgi:hypothetical protein
MTWRNLARTIESKGTTVSKAVSRADLHRRRQETQSQYFTPEWVAKGIWQAFTPIIESCKQAGVSWFSVFDNAIGSGRLLEGAPIAELEMYGLDTDTRCIDALCQDAAQAELNYQFEHGGMEDLTASGFHFAVINPPFSIHLESPNLTPYSCNSFGRFGQSTSATSHEYALEQALDAAVVTAAVLPVSMDGYCRAKRELKAVVYLPQDTFIAEGANVSTAIYFFLPGNTDQIQEVHLSRGEDWPALTLNPGFIMHKTQPRFRLAGVDQTEPVITLPVTGNPRVELHHHNRRIVVKYHCGLVQAKVANGLLRDTAVGTRLPKSVKHQGDGQFLLDVLLLQDNPEQQLEALADRINGFGGDAWISPTLSGYYKKLIKRHQRAVTPMYRMVKTKGPGQVQIKAKQRTLLEPGNFNSPSVGKGQIINATPAGGEYTIEHNGHTVTLRRDEVLVRFELIGGGDIAANDGQWGQKYPGLNHHFPEIAHQHRQRICKAGIDWLAPFQADSLTEGLVAPYGYIGAWEQGSGKARYALALAMMHDGRNMIAVESGLMPEMLLEIQKLGLSPSLWKVLANGDTPTAKINLVSYATLRQGTRIAFKRTVKRGTEEREETKIKIVRTNAQRWRRQISTLICDEGGLLANLNTQQTQAVKTLSARKLIVLDGTPQRNYPRDLLPLAVASAGNGVAHQPYGVRGKVLVEQRLLASANDTQRGEDAFYDNHVVTQWVTNEFREEMQSGGKREVPKINNLGLFRGWLAPNIQRRLRCEPELAIFKNCPDPERDSFTVQWDKEHLAHYLKTATEFANWYKNAHADTSRALNLVSVLARIGAVQRAANSPHVESKSSMGLHTPITSKQRFAIERVKHWIAGGRKVILYAESPEVLKRLHHELAGQGIDSVLFTGQQDIQKRAKALNDEFRYGSAPVLLSSWVGQRGLNLEQAGAVIFYERSWSATVEEQAIYRTQRPRQTLKVVVEYLHLAGSIDVYCAQLVEWKQKAADAGLDFGDQCGEEEEFLHLDTLLHRFCDEVLNMSVHEAKELLVA